MMLKGFQLVAFRIGKELFGVGIESIREIVRYPEITEVPDAPGFLEGVINLRGKIVPVVDLRKRLRLSGEEKTKSTRVLICEDGQGKSVVGLHVDAVTEVLKVQPDEIEGPPEMVSAIGVEYITGVAKIEGRLIILLDLRKILSMEDMKKLAVSVSETAKVMAA
jgi:purine-binding chemotaxis protein CheW